LGECKWKKDINAVTVVKDLLRKRDYLPRHYENFKDVCCLIFARSFSKTANRIDGKKVKCYSLETLAQLLESNRS
jgi:hypothetical protein